MKYSNTYTSRLCCFAFCVCYLFFMFCLNFLSILFLVPIWNASDMFKHRLEFRKQCWNKEFSGMLHVHVHAKYYITCIFILIASILGCQKFLYTFRFVSHYKIACACDCIYKVYYICIRLQPKWHKAKMRLWMSWEMLNTSTIHWIVLYSGCNNFTFISSFLLNFAASVLSLLLAH